MQITDITCTPLTIGKSLLRIVTNAGVEGWAEAPGGNYNLSSKAAVFQAYPRDGCQGSLAGPKTHC